MSTIGAYEAKTKFSELLERVECGERITITRHGRPVATIIPIDKPRDKEKARRAMEGLRKLARSVDLSDLSWSDIKKMSDQGRPGCD